MISVMTASTANSARTRREHIEFDGRTYVFDATPLYEGWDVVVYKTQDATEALIAFEFWRDGERGPLADPTLGGLAREVMDFLLPPAKLRHATAARFQHEVRVYTSNRGRAVPPREMEIVAKLVEYAKDGTGYKTPKLAVEAATEIAELMGAATAEEMNVATLEGAVIRGVLARAKLTTKSPIATEELKLLARLVPGYIELPRGRDEKGRVPYETAMKYLRERKALR